MSTIRVVNLDHEHSIPILPVVVPEGPSRNLNGRDTQQMSLGLGQQHRLTRSLASVGSSVCRICHTNNTVKEPLVSPCRCKGTLAHVHLSCLEKWLNQSCRSYCELCHYQYNAVETLRYNWPESLRIWITHPRNRRNVQSDLLIFTLLTVVMIGLIIVCLWGMHYFIIEGKKIGISKLWTRAVIWLFLGIVILGYIMTVYLLGKDQLLPWYRWWKSTVNVQLIVDPELFRPTTESFQEYENQIMSISASNMKTPTESRTIPLAVGNPDAAKTKIVDVSIGWKQAKPIRFDAAYNEQRFIYQADQPRAEGSSRLNSAPLAERIRIK